MTHNNKSTLPKHEPRTETLRIPGHKRKPRPFPLQPLRQAPAPPRPSQESSIRIVDDDGSSSVYGSLLRKPSVETRCSTLKSDILNYYLNSGTSNASVTTLAVTESAPPPNSTLDFGDFSQTLPGAETAVKTDREPTGLTPTATVAPSDFPKDAIAGFNFALDENEPAIAVLADTDTALVRLSFEAEPAPSSAPSDPNAASPSRPSPPPAPTPTYSLFPSLTTPPSAGIVLPLTTNRTSSSTSHTRNTSSSSSILYAPSTTIVSSLPQRPGLARLRSSTVSSAHPSTPSTSSTSTVRPSFSTTRSHAKDPQPSSRWSADTVSRPLLSPSSRAVSFATSTTSHTRSGSGPSLGTGTVGRGRTNTVRTSGTMTPDGSVTGSYINGRKRMNRPLLTPNTFDSVPISAFDDDESEDDGGRWRGWRRGMSWGSSGVKEIRGGEVRLGSAGGGGGMRIEGEGRGRGWRGWVCCGR